MLIGCIFSVFLLYGVDSMGKHRESRFWSTSLVGRGAQTWRSVTSENFVIPPITFLPYSFTLLCFGTSIEVAEPNLLIYNITRFGRGKFLTCILPIHFVQGPWPMHNYAEGDHHIGDQRVELYHGMCNIPGLRRKNFTRNFPCKKSKSKIV